MIADFHNDYLTNKNNLNVLIDYSNDKNIIIGAIFKGNKDYVYVKKLLNDFLKNKSENLYFAFEDFSYEEDLLNLSYGLLNFNPVYVGLTWNGENSLAYGVGSHGNVKRRGLRVIEQLKKRKISLDVAHLSEESFYDALNYTDDILCSHTCFFDLNPHPRNLKLRQIKEIVSRNGLIGLTLYRPFLTNKAYADLTVVVKHIDYFVQKFGYRNLAIGTDFYGCNDFPEGFSDYTFEEPLYEALIKLGYSEIAVRCVFYDNLSRFLKKA